MPDGKTRLLAKLLRKHDAAGRSGLYSYLRAHHAAFSAALDRGRPNWTGAAATLIEVGVLAANGGPPTADAVRKMWPRVVRDVADAKRRAAAASARARPVSRSPAVASGQHRTPPTTGAARPSSTPVAGDRDAKASFAPASGEVLSAHEKAEYAKLDEMFRQADRYLGTAPAIRKRS